MNPEGMSAWFYQGDGLSSGRRRTPPTISCRARARRWPRRWPDGSGRNSTRPATSRGSRCASRASAARWSPRLAARSSSSRAATSTPRSYTALARGAIEASEFGGPHDDMKLGLHHTARYYYYPGWHEPGPMTEFSFNKKAYEALPVDLQRTLDQAVAAVQVYGLTDFHAKNASALERLKAEFKGKVELLQLPAPVLRDLRKLAAEVVSEESEKTPMARKVPASFTKFQALVGPWDHVAEGAYRQLVGA